MCNVHVRFGIPSMLTDPLRKKAIVYQFFSTSNGVVAPLEAGACQYASKMAWVGSSATASPDTSYTIPALRVKSICWVVFRWCRSTSTAVGRSYFVFPIRRYACRIMRLVFIVDKVPWTPLPTHLHSTSQDGKNDDSRCRECCSHAGTPDPKEHYPACHRS